MNELSKQQAASMMGSLFKEQLTDGAFL